MKSMQIFAQVPAPRSIIDALWEQQHGVVQEQIKTLTGEHKKQALSCLGIYALCNEEIKVFRWVMEQWDHHRKVTWSANKKDSPWIMLVCVFAENKMKQDAFECLSYQGVNFNQTQNEGFDFLLDLVRQNDVDNVDYLLSKYPKLQTERSTKKFLNPLVIEVKSVSMMEILLKHGLPTHEGEHGVSNWLWRQSWPYNENSLSILKKIIEKNIPLDYADPQPYPDGTFMPQEQGYTYLGFVLSNQSQASYLTLEDTKAISLLLQTANLDLLLPEQYEFTQSVEWYKHALAQREKKELQVSTSPVKIGHSSRRL